MSHQKIEVSVRNLPYIHGDDARYAEAITDLKNHIAQLKAEIATLKAQLDKK